MTDEKRNLKLILISDIHLTPGKGTEDKPLKRPPHDELYGLLDSFEELVREIGPDAVIDLGDRIFNDTEENDIVRTTAVYERIYRNSPCPVLHVDGNHDVINISKETIASILHSPLYPAAVTVNGFKLLLLDSLENMIRNCTGTVSESQLRWLEEEMNNDDLPKIAFSHNPLHDHDITRNFNLPEKFYPIMKAVNSDEVAKVLEGGRNFLCHIGAHLHLWGIDRSGRYPYIATPPFSSHPMKTPADGFFTEMTFRSDGSISAVIHGISPRRIMGTFSL